MRAAVFAVSKTMAFTGGIVLVAIVLVTCVSVLGRAINTVAHLPLISQTFPGLSKAIIATGVGPITGDYELTEAGIAFAIFAFLPWCQLNQGHATVDVFTAFLPRGVNRVITLVAEVLLAIALILITWRLWVGMIEKLEGGDTTFLLQFPVWWGYAASVVAAVTACIVAVYLIGVRVRELAAGRDVLDSSGGAGH